MKDWREIHAEFSCFGRVEVTCRYPYLVLDPRVDMSAVVSAIDAEVIILLDPARMQGADLSTDEWCRRAIYELAEQAIALAKYEYVLTRGPYLEVTSDIRWKDRNPYDPEICLVSGKLTLAITDKP